MKQRKRKILDYTAEEIKWFDSMHAVLKAYNQSLGSNSELPLPLYSDAQMAEYSIYRELLISDSAN